MENYKLLFTITLFLLVISTTSLGLYTSNVIKETKSDFNSKLEQNKNEYNNKLTTIQEQFDDKLEDLSSEVDAKTKTVKQELNSELQNTQDQLNQNLNTLGSNLGSQITQVKQESSEKIAGLEKQVLNINIQSQDFTSIINEVIKSVVSIKADDSIGSGVIVDTRGYITTNYHVIQGKNTITVTESNGNTHNARVVGFDSNVDLAIIKIDGTYSKLNFANTDQTAIGEKVIALGSPAGLDFSVTEGIVSATNRIANGIRYLQIDVPINPGNSGGPLVNKAGEIEGINTMKISGFEGIGFAISANSVKPIVNGLINNDAG